MRSRYRDRLDPGAPLYRILWYEFCRLAIHLLAGLIYGLRIEGRNNVPPTGPVLIVANHQSHLDPPFISAVTRRNMHFLARLGLFTNPFFRFLIKSLNAIPLDTTKGDTAAIKTAIERLRAGRLVLIFAEGERTPDGGMRPFQPGAALLIRRSKAPVLPIAIEGAFDTWPRHRSRPRLRGRVRIAVGKPIPMSTFEGMTTHEMLDSIARTVDDLRLTLRARLRHESRGAFPAPGPGDRPYTNIAPARDTEEK